MPESYPSLSAKRNGVQEWAARACILHALACCSSVWQYPQPHGHHQSTCSPGPSQALPNPSVMGTSQPVPEWFAQPLTSTVQCGHGFGSELDGRWRQRSTVCLSWGARGGQQLWGTEHRFWIQVTSVWAVPLPLTSYVSLTESSSEPPFHHKFPDEERSHGVGLLHRAAVRVGYNEQFRTASDK